MNLYFLNSGHCYIHNLLVPWFDFILLYNQFSLPQVIKAAVNEFKAVASGDFKEDELVRAK